MAIDKRLKNVQQADLTESRVNDDFVYWLKTWGSNILIVLLLLAAAGMAWQWWDQKKEQARDDAWAELNGTALPEALIEVAQKHQGKDSVSVFAELTAADRYAEAIRKGKRFDREATAADAEITPALREEWLKEADRLYASVAKATANPKSMGMRMFHVNALFGQAAIAEDRGDLKSAENYLNAIADAVKGTDQSALADVAAKRIATLGDLATSIVFESRPVLPAIPNSATPPPLSGPAPFLIQEPGMTGPLTQTPDGGYTQKLPGATLTLKPIELGGSEAPVDAPNAPEGTVEGAPTPGPAVKPAPATPPSGGNSAIPSRKPASPPAAAPPAATPPAATPPAAAPPSPAPAAPKAP